MDIRICLYPVSRRLVTRLLTTLIMKMGGKMKKQIAVIIVSWLMFSVGVCFAQKPNELDAVSLNPESASIGEAKQNLSVEKTGTLLEDIFESYAQKHEYDKLYAHYEKLLKELPREGYNEAQIYFFMALARQQEIAYWKETKNWEGIYDKGAAYKKEILDFLNKAQNLAGDEIGLLLSIKYLKWQVINEDDSDAGRGLFNDLVNTAKEKAVSIDTVDMIKSMGDELSSMEDKNFSRRLYDVFLEKIGQLGLESQDLKKMADDFLSAGNAYLAKVLLSFYLDGLKEDSVVSRETVLTADKFAVQDSGEALDPLYAESLYAKAFETAGFSAFSGTSQYRRAFNLERIKEYTQAFEAYQNLLNNFPDYDYKQEIYYRLGVLAAYAKKDIVLACEYFHKLTEEFPRDPQALSAFYQLGLLNQWQQDKEKAKSFYNELIAAAPAILSNYEKSEVVLLAQDRLKEIKENKDMKYSLKLFLSGIFVIGQTQTLGFLSVDVTAQPPNENANVPVRFVVTTSKPETGCMVPTYSYEWSGELGNLSNVPNSFDLKTEYVSPAIKLVQVAVVGPQGVEGVGFEMVKIIIEKSKKVEAQRM